MLTWKGNVGSPDKEDDEADNTDCEANLSYGCGQDTQRILHSHTASEPACEDSCCALMCWHRITACFSSQHLEPRDLALQGRRTVGI